MTARTHGFTFYELLGVSETADTAAITRSYHKLAKLYHPDSNPDGGAQTAEMFKALAVAYETLRDDSLRAAYDANLRSESGRSSTESQSHAYTPPPKSPPKSEPKEPPRTYADYSFRSSTPFTASDVIDGLKGLNRRGRIAFWWSPSLLCLPFFAWLEARRITGNRQYTRYVLAYLIALFVIGATGVSALVALYWIGGIAHVARQHRVVRAQAIARLASRAR